VQPQFRLSGVQGAITGPSGRAIKCEYIDESGSDDDKVILTVDDRLGELVVPMIGDEVTLEMGYIETGLFKMGTFKIKTVKLAGWGQWMEIEATGTDLGTGKMKEQDTENFTGNTIKEIVEKKAKIGGLTAKVGPDIGATKINYRAQTGESHLHFLKRLANDYGGTVKTTNGFLTFMKTGSGVGLSGAVAHYPFNVKTYAATLDGRFDHGDTPQGGWVNSDKGERHEAKVPPIPSRNPIRQPEAKIRLSPFWPDGENQAKLAATAQASKLSRMAGFLNIVLIGDPTIFAEATLTVINVRKYVDGDWLIKKAIHVIDEKGYETVIQAEYPGEEGGSGGKVWKKKK